MSGLIRKIDLVARTKGILAKRPSFAFLLVSGVFVVGFMLPGSADEVILKAEDLTRLGSGPLIATSLVGLPAEADRPVVDPKVKSAAAQQLRSLVARGVSQGFDRLLYDNRDRDHSTLSSARFPNLTFIEYGPELAEKGLDYGLAGAIQIPATLIGNSSTALTAGLNARSLPRFAMTTQGYPARAYGEYRFNSMYVYPEHRDHDAVDRYPANWPYTTISQGSSRSDIAFLDAFAMTIAAFPEATRARLEEERLVAPTVQMIMRRNLKNVRSQAHYLSGLAHPTVFPSESLMPGRMIGHAAAMQPEDIPPLVSLKVEEEDFSRAAGLAGLDERLFTTPSAVARLWRSHAWEREMIISAEKTHDPNGHPVTIDWVLLRGDPSRVRIEPLDPAGKRARITVNWHDPFVLPNSVTEDGAPRMASRVDIGVFASNGKSVSAPAFVSIDFPTHQRREYSAHSGEPTRLQSINYDAASREEYYDPVLFWSARWVDEFEYGEDGKLTGWARVSDGDLQKFDQDGRMSDGSNVTYEVVHSRSDLPVLAATVEE